MHKTEYFRYIFASVVSLVIANGVISLNVSQIKISLRIYRFTRFTSNEHLDAYRTIRNSVKILVRMADFNLWKMRITSTLLKAFFKSNEWMLLPLACITLTSSRILL